jgi:hypothetical protein
VTTEQLAALTSFAVAVDFGRDQTVLDVIQPGLARPVARLVSAAPLRRRAAYQLFTGPDLTQVTGQISPSGALHPDGRPVGIVNLSGGRVADAEIHPMSGAQHAYVVQNPALWRVLQTGRPPLTGEAVGRGTRLLFNKLTDFSEQSWLDIRPPDFLVALTFRFAAADSAGFTVRRAARRPRFEVTVADPEIDRSLVLACLTAMTKLITWTPRQEAANMAAPLRRLLGR